MQEPQDPTLSLFEKRRNDGGVLECPLVVFSVPSCDCLCLKLPDFSFLKEILLFRLTETVEIQLFGIFDQVVHFIAIDKVN
jgi:hypothetical protein